MSTDKISCSQIVCASAGIDFSAITLQLGRAQKRNFQKKKSYETSVATRTLPDRRAAIPPDSQSTMNNSKCLFNSAIALRRVFLNNVLASDAVATRREAQCLLLGPSHQAQHQQTRSFSIQKPLLRFAMRSFKVPPPKEEPQTRLPRDREIRAPFVHIAGPGGLSEPQRTQDILNDLAAFESLHVVSMPGPNKPSAEEDDGRARPQWPVCRVVDMRKLRQDEKNKKKEERKKSVGSKELEINWGIAMNDLEMTKLRQLRKFLCKGMTVQITLVAKAKSRKSGKKHMASPDEAKQIVKAIKGAVEAVPGSVEIKTDGDVGKQMMLVFQGPSGGYTPPAEAEAEAEAA